MECFLILNKKKMTKQENTFCRYKMCFLGLLFFSCFDLFFHFTWFAIIKPSRKIWKNEIISCWILILFHLFIFLVEFYMNWPLDNLHRLVLLLINVNSLFLNLSTDLWKFENILNKYFFFSVATSEYFLLVLKFEL